MATIEINTITQLNNGTAKKMAASSVRLITQSGKPVGIVLGFGDIDEDQAAAIRDQFEFNPAATISRVSNQLFSKAQ
jgi:hypothetical protein